MKPSPTHSIGLYEIKEHKPWLQEEYLQSLVQRMQAKIQSFTGYHPKQFRQYKQGKVIKLTDSSGKNI